MHRTLGGRRSTHRSMDDGGLVGLADENVQAATSRSPAHGDLERPGAMLLSTSNKSELAVGYSTLYGDMCGGLAPIGDLYKTEVFELARWMNEHHRSLGFEHPPIPVSQHREAALRGAASRPEGRGLAAGLRGSIAYLQARIDRRAGARAGDRLDLRDGRRDRVEDREAARLQRVQAIPGDDRPEARPSDLRPRPRRPGRVPMARGRLSDATKDPAAGRGRGSPIVGSKTPRLRPSRRFWRDSTATKRSVSGGRR